MVKVLNFCLLPSQQQKRKGLLQCKVKFSLSVALYYYCNFKIVTVNNCSLEALFSKAQNISKCTLRMGPLKNLVHKCLGPHNSFFQNAQFVTKCLSLRWIFEIGVTTERNVLGYTVVLSRLGSLNRFS